MNKAAVPGADLPPATAPAPRADDVLLRLRRETGTWHNRVEERLFPAALADRRSYTALLVALLGLHEPLERGFPDVSGLPDLVPDLQSRRKAGRIRSDLSGLGQPVDVVPGRLTVPLTDLGTAFGAFYVLEGSTLGGRVLEREVRERLGDVPTAFLSGYGNETGRRWKQARSALVRHVARAGDPARAADVVVAGATTTFRSFDGLLAADGWALP
jgi:heme oxygenase